MSIRRFILGVTLICMTAAALFAAAPLAVAQVTGGVDQAQEGQGTPGVVNGPAQIFIPLLIANPAAPEPAPSPTPPPDSEPDVEQGSVFGFDLYSWLMGLEDISQEEVDWIRPEPIIWSSVEPKRGDRKWEVLAGLEGNLKLAAQTGTEAVVIVTGTPAWAGKVPNSKCGPIKQNELDSFARFMGDLVSRYSTPPYAVRYWELWNEPDVDPSNSSLSTYGCWGDDDDPYYGGGYYAEMLKAVYPAVKAANPQAQLLVGGLLLGCDPRNPDQCVGRDPSTGKFLEGILRGGGAAYFDGVSFHAFDGYAGIRGLYGNANWGAAWDTTGPSAVVKARFLRDVLAAYGASDKYLIATEAALTHSQDVCDQDCQLSKAYYVQQLYTVTLAEGLRSTLWYCLRCAWRQVDMFDGSGQPLPAYHAYLAAWRALQNARFLREVNLDGNVRVYEFQRGDRTVWAVWALDQGEHHIQLPSRPVTAVDVLGASIPVDESSLTVTLKPVYLEWQSVTE